MLYDVSLRTLEDFCTISEKKKRNTNYFPPSEFFQQNEEFSSSIKPQIVKSLIEKKKKVYFKIKKKFASLSISQNCINSNLWNLLIHRWMQAFLWNYRRFLSTFISLKIFETLYISILFISTTIRYRLKIFIFFFLYPIQLLSYDICIAHLFIRINNYFFHRCSCLEFSFSWQW